jgi:hypothetical protein
MSTIEVIKEAIAALKDRTGSSVIALNKWIETEKKVSKLTLFCPDHTFDTRSKTRKKLQKISDRWKWR